MSGPVSAALAAEVATVVQHHGLVVWMDRYGHYTAFVDELARRHDADELGFPVLGYRGSFVELMIALEPYGNALDKPRLLLHLPGYEAQGVRVTPVFEQYAAAHKFLKGLETLITEAAAGRVGPEEIRSFVATPGITLAQADAWLEGHMSGARSGTTARLGALDPKHLVDGLLGEDRSLARDLCVADHTDLAGHLEKTFGMDAAWRRFYRVPESDVRDLELLIGAFAGWLLSVEFVHDLAREPYTLELRPLKKLPRPFAEQTLALARHFRERHPRMYAPAADEAEQRIPEDALHATAAELGKIDTFRFEEERVREAALDAACEGRWADAHAWAEQREGVAFWLDASPPKRWAWTLVHCAAKLGIAIEKAGPALAPDATLADAVAAYVERGQAVDHAHRRFEQRHHEIMSGEVHDRDRLLAVVSTTRRAYRDWADDVARAFSRACRTSGFLPDESLQQRTIYDRVVAPLVHDGGRVAVFLVDAFRYEMAVELKAEMEKERVAVELKPALAELPTITAVGMNVLAPVNQGQQLRPVLSGDKIRGFAANEGQVVNPEARATLMGRRADGKPAKRLELDAIVGMSTQELRKVVDRAPAVLLVHSQELDEGGEVGLGVVTFERTLRQLRAAWSLLSQAGVKQFVFLADHGFLLQDETTREQPYGRRSDPDRRHVLEEHTRKEPGMDCVPLSTLRYQIAEERYLLLREDTAVWATTRGVQSFVHGGNSPQERVIPVLVVRRHGAGTADTPYEVQAEALEDRHGRRRVRVQLRIARKGVGTLAFTGPSFVTLALRAKDRADVSVTITDVEGGAKLESGALRVPVRAEWSTVYFELEAKAAGPVQVEIFHPDGRDRVEPCTIAAWFDVQAPARRADKISDRPPIDPGSAPPVASAAPIPASRWEDSIDDEGFRKVFLHIDSYGTVTEADLEALLGSARRVRAFARYFDELVTRVPFRVRIETTGFMKTYVKEGR